MFPGYGTRIFIKPASFGVEQRVEASQIAEVSGMGVRMEVHSAHTEFYADPTVPVGGVKIYCSLRYKEWPTYVTTLKAPDEEWDINKVLKAEE